MNFRGLISDIRQGGFVGLVCLAGISLSRGQDVGGRAIEIVPAHGATINTNANEPAPASTRDFDNLLPGSSHSFDFLEAPEQQSAPPAPYIPPVSRPFGQRDQEWLDRRKNWVFMTPQELMSDTEAERILGLRSVDKKLEDREPTTAMERYYRRLYESEHQAGTNKVNMFSDSDSKFWEKQTNSTTGNVERNDYTEHPFDSPFITRPDPGIFQPSRSSTFTDVFDLNQQDNPATPSEETLREKREQEAHMEAFKQLWNIDQPAPLPAMSGPAFGNVASAPGQAASVPQVLGAANPSLDPSSLQQNSPAPRTTLNADRSMLMQRPNFTDPQRRF